MVFGRKRKQKADSQSKAMDETTQTGDPLDNDSPDALESEDIPEVEPLTEIEALEAERDDYKERWLRAQADFQNLRRRTGADIDSAVVRAKSEVLSEAITILDYLDMALATPVTTDEAKNLKIGVEMTRGQLQGLFDRLSVKPIPGSDTFDPLIHQAVSTVETTDKEPGTIIEVVRNGYLMGETVLRFTQVRVAAAPEPPAAEASGETSAADPTDNAPSETPTDNA